MTDKKSQHIIAIQQVLAQFDIQTQVKRITLQVMNSYTLGNKQAFSYIKDWQSKFIEFETRLTTAQSYYKNLQININSKIQVTNSVNHRLQKFAQQFWSGMKESAQSVQQMRKNYMNLVKEAGSQAATIRSLQKQIKQYDKKVQSIQSKIYQQTTKLLQKITKNQDQITIKNNQRRSQAQKILLKISQAKAQLNSKAEIMQQLSKDLNLYKNQKISINSQIANIYQQINNRVLISDFNQIRVYIDNSTIQNTLKIKQNYIQLKQQIAVQVTIRQKQTKQRDILRQKLKKQIQIQIKQVKQNIQKKHDTITKLIQQMVLKAQKNYKQNWQRITKNTQRIQITQNSIQQIRILIQQINTNIDDKQNHIQQAQSNILSINHILKQIQKQNTSRGEQLAKLKVDADDKGDLGQQIKKIAQKILAHDQNIRKIGQQTVVINEKFENSNISILKTITQIQNKNNQQIEKLDQFFKKQCSTINIKYEQRCDKIQQNIEQRHKQILSSFSNLIKQKIDSIKDKFIFLQRLNEDMEIFKKTFEQQLSMNDQLNKQVKQKMDRMFSMFTKLKTDIFLKMQTLGLDIGKNMNKIKQNSKILMDLCSLSSHLNQIIQALLCVEMWRQVNQDKDSVQQYKIASLLEGWVLEVVKDKAKYRGQFTTRRALIQICLEQHVKNGDKIKGGLIQNGKQFFNKMIGGSEEYQQLRRRSASKKKQRQSELPKVYR